VVSSTKPLAAYSVAECCVIIRRVSGNAMPKRHTARPKKITTLAQGHFVSRRELLCGAAATLACSFIPVASSAASPSPVSPNVFTAKERKTLQAMVSRLVPSDENGPGAIEAGCMRYIELALADAYRSSKDTYKSGLAALDSYANKISGTYFTSLPPARQDEILTEFEQNLSATGFTESATFFKLVLAHTREGMFGDPSYGGNTNFVGWDLIGYPGPRLYVSPAMQKLDAKTPRSRVSVKQWMHGAH
jgi:gluconate 2-dehydrogenase gamma chain